MKHLSVLILLVFTGVAVAQDIADGQFKDDGSAQVWQTQTSSWVTPEQFWQNYVTQKVGRTWPSSKEYPPYSKVRERDTFLVQVDSGTCLMEFFHERWRRANDVVRWDDRFNEHSGCADVFK
jgi:hypothetical protein